MTVLARLRQKFLPEARLARWSRRRASAALRVTAISLVTIGASLGAAFAAGVGPDPSGAIERPPLNARSETSGAAVAAGDTVIVAGPYLFSTPNGNQTTSIEYFSTTITPGRRYLVRTQKVTGTFSYINVLVNEAVAAGPADMASATSVTRIMDLEPVDTVRAQVTGNAGATIRVTVLSVSDPSYVLYGPARLSVNAGFPSLRQDTFVVLARTAGPYHLHWRNGPNGAPQASSALIKINTTTVLNSSDSAFVAQAGRVTTITLSAGQKVIRSEIGGATGAMADVWVTATDTTRPKITIAAPAANVLTGSDSVVVSGSVQDQTAVGVLVNGVAATMTGSSFGVKVALPTEGNNVLTIRATDNALLFTDSLRTVRRDRTAPALTVTGPTDGLVTKQDSVTVAGAVSDASHVTANVNGINLPIASGAFSRQIALVEGTNVLSVTATDSAGNATTVVRQVRRDTQAPVLTVTAPIEGATTTADSIMVSGTVADSSAVTVSANGVALAVASGAFGGRVPLNAGANTITIIAVDAAANQTTIVRHVTYESTVQVGGPLPVDSSLGAPAINPTTPVSMLTATSFLYTGANPVQTGVAPGTIVLERAAVARGRVLTRAGTPLSGVTVVVASHPEYGQTVTRANGLYDLAVNGGARLRLQFSKSGYLPIERQVEVSWQAFRALDDAIMTTVDAVSTVITFQQPIEVAQSSVVTDERGSRRTTVMFDQGTQATLVLPNGQTQVASSLTVRATEYTVGPNGPLAMPGDLPPTSAYTHAVEFSADEALSAGAVEVRFSKPVAYYIDNFLGFRTGLAVPVGTFDRAIGQWVPQPDGRVVKIVGVTGGKADVAIDTTGSAADSASLATLGITDLERQELASRYAVGNSLWRVETTHFSPFDQNFLKNIPNYLDPFSNPFDDDQNKGECKATGSTIGCNNQSLGESISLPGASADLHYNSERARGSSARAMLNIQLTGESTPSSLEGIEVRAYVFGRTLMWSYAPGQIAPRLVLRADLRALAGGLDAYGRPIAPGAHMVSTRIRYIYRGAYTAPLPRPTQYRSFGVVGRPDISAMACDSTLPGCRPRIDVVRESSQLIHVGDALRSGALGGWTLTSHHSFDPVGGELLLGDGTRRTVRDLGMSSKTVVGNGTNGQSGDGGPADQASIGTTNSFGIAPDGSLYFGADNANKIRRVAPNGIISTISTKIRLSSVTYGPDGKIYGVFNHLVYRVDPVTGDTVTVAGGGTDFTTDGASAVGTARLFLAFGSVGPQIAVGSDGSFYVLTAIATSQPTVVRRVMPNGSIYTVAGTGVSCGTSASLGDGQPATQVKLCNPIGIAVAPSGDLYIVDQQYAATVLRKVGLDGTIGTVVGTATACPNATTLCGDNGPAAQAGLAPNTRGISIAADGTLLLADFEKVRAIRPDGSIISVFGLPSPVATYGGDGTPIRQTTLAWAQFATLSPDGTMHVLDQQAYRIVRARSPFPGLGIQNLVVGSESGSEYYVFDGTGRHLSTRDALTNAALLQFIYDASGRLTTLTDVDGNVTSIQRDGNGNPTAIVGPFGQRNGLALDARGYLTSVTNPANEVVQVQHDSLGLLTRLTDAKGNPPHVFAYDATGRLTRDDNPVGAFQALTRTETDSSSTVVRASTLGRRWTYFSDRERDGSARRLLTDPAGLQTRQLLGSNQVDSLTTPDGTVSMLRWRGDPRWNLAAPFADSFTVRLPSGLTTSGRASRSVTLAVPGDLSTLVTATDSNISNTRLFRSVFTAATRTLVETSAEGRAVTSVLDSLGRTTEVRRTGLAPVRYSFGSRGFLTAITQAGRATTYSYDSTGRLASTRDPLRRVERYAYDSVGRIKTQTLFDGRVIGYGYDANGNLISLTPPSRPAHAFAYRADDQVSTYSPPAAGLPVFATQYGYNADRQVTRVLRPDSLAVDIAYDTAGRVTSLTLPTGSLGVGYNAAGQLSSLGSPTGGSLALTYDGFLPKTSTWSGAVSGSVGVSYDSDFRVSSVTVNGATPIGASYDRDNLLTAAGSLTLSRDAGNGRLTGTSLGSATTSYAYDDSVGALLQLTAKHGATTLLDVAYARDSIERISALTETIQGTARTLAFGYDSLGRLDQVQLNGTLVSDYDYDANGNRIRLTTPNGISSATVDDQDRLLTYGAAGYAYTANGELKWKIVGTDTTKYTYDVLGNLTKVVIPNGPTVEYLVDGQGRRIGKKVNAVLVQGFLYQGQLAPIAELDGSNVVVSRFVYGTRENVPEYMIKGGVTYRLVTDHLGSVRLVVNTGTGAVAQRMDYDEYGRVTQNTSPGFQPFGYAGGLYESATELVRFGARDYDAETGRWTSKDPIGFWGGSSNVLSYAMEDPANRSDASGLQVLVIPRPRGNLSPPFAGPFDRLPQLPPILDDALNGIRTINTIALAAGIQATAACYVESRRISRWLEAILLGAGLVGTWGDPDKVDPIEDPTPIEWGRPRKKPPIDTLGPKKAKPGNP
ncbi:MAG: RHS repeat-associated core domain-containing protein [Gemmatimonadaceae bacterium]|nr:RHS repeat-associated core domain-containing protein [Gemmatimonadaceae bacterium]